MLCGIPGTGKSYLRGKIMSFAGNNFIPLSTDILVERCAAETDQTYGAVFSSIIKEAEKAMSKSLEMGIKSRRDLIWDQTNVSAKTRMKKLKRIPKEYYKICIAVTGLTPDQIFEINRRRVTQGRDIPIVALKSMIFNWEDPNVVEGFDEVLMCQSEAFFI